MLSYVLTRSYGDVDELCAEARSWDLELVPTASGNFRSSLFQARSGAVEVSRGRFRGPLLQRGAPPPGHWTFVVPASPTVRFLWRGHRVRGDSILVFPLNGELHSVSGRDFDVYTIAVEDAHLQVVAEALHLPSPRRLVAGCEVFTCGRGRLAQLRSRLGEIRQSIGVGSSPEGPVLSARFLTELPALLLGGIAAASSRTEGMTPSRLAVARTVASHMPDRPDLGVLSVKSLASLTGSSARTVRRAFLELYGCGPKEFLLTHRYNAARRLLRDADPTSTDVSTLAGRLGFWHAGRFAGEYHRRFGELPSQTLKRRGKLQGSVSMP